MLVRDVRSEDLAVVVGLIGELNEGTGNEVTVTEADLQRDFLGNSPSVHMRVVEIDGVVCGYAVWNESYTSRSGRHRVYMSDLCVTRSMRGRGVGKALVADLAEMCVAKGYDKLEWRTQVDNPARQFYEALGGRLRTDLVLYALDVSAGPWSERNGGGTGI